MFRLGIAWFPLVDGRQNVRSFRERRDALKKFMNSIWIILFGLCKFALSESCFWSGSDSGARTVTAIRSTCAYGKLTWHRPTSALLLEIKPNFYNGTLWTACIRPSLDSNISISGLVNGSLIKSEESKRGSCFATIKSTIRIYLQAITPSNGTVDFYYMTRSGILPKSSNDESKCRPCTNEEIIQAYCTSDLIFNGRYIDYKSGHLYFIMDNLLRRPFDAGDALEKTKRGRTVVKLAISKCMERVFAAITVQDLHSYLIIAKTELGRAELICAPMIKDWEKLRKSILDDQNKDSICDIR